MSVLDSFRYQGLDGLRVGRFDLGINSSFIVYRLADTIIDTGPSNQWKFVRPFVCACPFSQLLLTHHHEDHTGNADAIYRLTGVQPLAPAGTVDILKRGFRIPPIQKIIWGSAGKVKARPLPDHVQIGGEAVEAIFTPGHAKDMTCYLLPERGWLFSADLYLANYLKLLRSDEDIPTLLDSIRKVLERDFEVILCPHRGVVEDGKKRLREKYDYLLNLADRAQSLEHQGLDLSAVTRRLLGRENMMSVLSRYNFSKRNLIASCLQVDLSRYR
ncbi:MBL fold metallo-hydrolase [Microbulbifer thermotolerans]|uniref:MBL fold metallo-hydrolase n=1 Tax=Microbulbifer thermotolerans TaxID=252514 RepID=A0A143HMW6_MICTH|nr:MBL fold metallo-hydrolase [Microbulbifer thermotolerans]AMX03074.1 MBL fold metallo-hydrolase [Microbulbifer thermotolerans]MCX2779043.1 MBL fold metallo-hydrolase [Microbulbifer thermotolerans]MCX2784220.1 MBL fold metallo-hydrolase [Microbulbifer thermotolerans]MCX2795685.1 MBL fold metallo-hydrolase [Microbulbifer thermotolerans]MCX2802073.1 MBL fold metallo-hydrolase [Microbulbifer thermotolerans]